MKKKWYYLIILLLLLILAAVLIFRNRGAGTMDQNSDFAVQDTSIITRIFLADKNNQTVLLQRGPDSTWTVNNKYKASSYAINIFLKTLLAVEVKTPVSKEAHDNVVKQMAANSVKVEIYQTAYRFNLFGWVKWWPYEKLTKTYYVGFATQDNLGTYMLMEGSGVPFITYIPGFKGFLSTRYSAKEKDWRDHLIYNIRYNDLKSVSMWMPEYEGKSFKAVKTGPRDFQLYGIDSTGKVLGRAEPFDTLKLMDLFSAFNDIRYEAIVDDISKKQIDSVKAAIPYMVLVVENMQGQTNMLKSWRRRAPSDATDMDGNPLLWDPDRMFALVNNGEDFVLIQYFVFDKIIRSKEFYSPNYTPPSEK